MSLYYHVIRAVPLSAEYRPGPKATSVLWDDVLHVAKQVTAAAAVQEDPAKIICVADADDLYARHAAFADWTTAQGGSPLVSGQRVIPVGSSYIWKRSTTVMHPASMRSGAPCMGWGSCAVVFSLRTPLYHTNDYESYAPEVESSRLPILLLLDHPATKSRESVRESLRECSPSPCRPMFVDQSFGLGLGIDDYNRDRPVEAHWALIYPSTRKPLSSTTAKRAPPLKEPLGACLRGVARGALGATDIHSRLHRASEGWNVDSCTISALLDELPGQAAAWEFFEGPGSYRRSEDFQKLLQLLRDYPVHLEHIRRENKNIHAWLVAEMKIRRVPKARTNKPDRVPVLYQKLKEQKWAQERAEEEQRAEERAQRGLAEKEARLAAQRTQEENPHVDATAGT